MFIETIIGSQEKVKILRVLLETKIAYSLADIKELSGLSIGAIHKVKNLLLKENLIIEKKGKGKQKYYQINIENKYFNNLATIFDYEKNERRNIPVHIWNKLETLCSKLKNRFNHKSRSIKDIILYGSLARGEFRINSDIDLIIIIENEFQEETKIRKLCGDAKIKNKISPTFVTQKEIELARSKGSDYYENLYKEGLRLI
ncbi:nucleotidyltransferase domain-containing protein [Candidatus Pacearchaeota archaeon]|nr:nucleotidyltransferase domain-containing protein [Candidatus Pacearchaeota archaeon]